MKKIFALMFLFTLSACESKITTENGQHVVRLPCDRKFITATMGGHTPLNYIHRAMRANEEPETFLLTTESIGEDQITFIESRCGAAH